MRPGSAVVTAALTAALALVVAPGLAGSRTAAPGQTLEAAAFQAVSGNANTSRSLVTVGGLDAAARSGSWAAANESLIEPPAEALPVPTARIAVRQPDSRVATAVKAPKQTISGYASFYDNGTTAMRLPHGTVVRICGAGGCVERVIDDYGPSPRFRPVRIADLTRADFFAVCGCPWYSGTTRVTVGIY